MVGIQSALITIPINVLLVALFKSIRAKDPADETENNEASIEDGKILTRKKPLF